MENMTYIHRFHSQNSWRPRARLLMDIRSLRYFVETARLSSFTQAAELLHVTQSTISKMVHQLEEELGTPLFVRDGRRLGLTDTGRVVYGRGPERLTNALIALKQMQPRVAERTWTWSCDKCSDPECEHRLFTSLAARPQS